MEISLKLLMLMVLFVKTDSKDKHCTFGNNKKFDISCEASGAVISSVDVTFGRGLCSDTDSCCVGESPNSIVDRLSCYWKHNCSIAFPRDIIIMAKDYTCSNCIGMNPQYMMLNEYRCFTPKNKTDSSGKPVVDQGGKPVVEQGKVDICGDDTTGNISMDSGLLLSHTAFPWEYDPTRLVRNLDQTKVCKKEFWLTADMKLLVSVHKIDIAEGDRLWVRTKFKNGTTKTDENVQNNTIYSDDTTASVQFEFGVAQGSNGGQGFVLCFKMVPTGEYDSTMNACDIVMTRSNAVKVTETDNGCTMPFWGCFAPTLTQPIEKVKCVAGTFHDAVTDSCIECKRGFYQSLDNEDSCIACAQGLTTLETGAENLADCFDPCDSSKTWNGSMCVPCAIGFFRHKTLHNSCQSCKTGFITLTDMAVEAAECASCKGRKCNNCTRAERKAWRKRCKPKRVRKRKKDCTKGRKKNKKKCKRTEAIQKAPNP